jgi:hypothetical protein
MREHLLYFNLYIKPPSLPLSLSLSLLISNMSLQFLQLPIFHYITSFPALGISSL